MYMITRGNSKIPLIKLSEGYSILKQDYVTVVCGSNGERLKPIKVWEKPFTFFGKEKLNAEFISKTELIYVKLLVSDKTYSIDVVKYRLPEYMIGNRDLDEDVVRHTKPMTESLFHINIDADASLSVLDTVLNNIGNGVFRDAIVSAVNKVTLKDSLCYALEG